MTTHLSGPLIVDGGVFGGVLGRPGGKAFRVNPSGGGADDVDVPWWDVDEAEVFSTLQGAIDACVEDRGDVIVVKNGSHAVTEAVTFDKSGITVVAAGYGVNSEAGGEKFTINAAASYTDGPAAIITKPCRIIGLGFEGRQTAGEDLLIDCQEAGGFSGGFSELINCRFGVWYGAMTHGVKMIGGAVNKLYGCTFDGLFGGWGTSAIGIYNDTGGVAVAYLEVLRCRFQATGTGKHAIKHATGSVPVGFLYAHNYMLPGFGASGLGKFLDNNSVAAVGMCADNWLAPLANKAAAFENLTNATIGFAANHYEEA